MASRRLNLCCRLLNRGASLQQVGPRALCTAQAWAEPIRGATRQALSTFSHDGISSGFAAAGALPRSHLHFHSSAFGEKDSENLAASRGSDEDEDDDEDDNKSASEYEGPLAVVVRRVKLLSLTSLAMTVVGAPILVQLSSPESISFGAKTGIVGSLVTFGFFTTALLQWFVSPYLLKLKVDGDDVEATVLNVLAQRKTMHFKVADVGQPETSRPLATFAAKGKIFYLDTNVVDERLLEKLGIRKQVFTKPREDDEEDD